MALVEEWVEDASMVDLQMVVTVFLTFLSLPSFSFFSWNFDLFVVLGCGMSCSCLWDYGVETWLWVIGRFELGRERIALFHVTKHSSFAACLWLVGNGFWIENLSYGFGDRPAHSCFRT